jgi:hypothetical protein
MAAVEDRVAAMPPIVLGKNMSDDLGATVGSVVLVVSPGELTPLDWFPSTHAFASWEFSTLVFMILTALGVASLYDAQQLEGLGDAHCSRIQN